MHRAERDGWVHFLPAARAGLTWALIDRGQLDPAAATLAAARTDASWEQSTMQTLVLEAEARIHLARGQPQDALDAALAAGRIFEWALVPHPSIAAWRGPGWSPGGRTGGPATAQG